MASTGGSDLPYGIQPLPLYRVAKGIHHGDVRQSVIRHYETEESKTAGAFMLELVGMPLSYVPIGLCEESLTIEVEMVDRVQTYDLKNPKKVVGVTSHNFTFSSQKEKPIVEAFELIKSSHLEWTKKLKGDVEPTKVLRKFFESKDHIRVPYAGNSDLNLLSTDLKSIFDVLSAGFLHNNDKKPIMSITAPEYFLGGIFSSTGFHLDPYGLATAHTSIWGDGKFILTIPELFTDDFTRFLETRCPGETGSNCSDAWKHGRCIPRPDVIIASGIPVYGHLIMPGQILIIRSGVFHAVVNPSLCFHAAMAFPVPNFYQTYLDHPGDDCSCGSRLKLPKLKASLREPSTFDSWIKCLPKSFGVKSHRYRCTWPGCEYHSTHKSTFDRHCDTHLKKTERPFQCARCGKRFTRKFRLQSHVVSRNCPKPTL